MDVLSSLLASPRGRQVFVLRSELQAPWAFGVRDRAPLTLVAVVRGGAVITCDRDGPHEQPSALLGAGDVALVRGPGGYAVADAPGTPEQATIGVGQVCTKPDGSPLRDFRDLGGLAWANAPPDSVETVLLTGTYEDVHQVSLRVLEQLPRVVVARAGSLDARAGAVLEVLLAETQHPQAAQGPVLDRLVDLLLVMLLRARFRDPAHRPPWYAAQEHPVAGAALRRLHHEPHRAWTLQLLAADVGVSRATLARTFHDVVGQPPMGYLTQWRLDLATELLRSTDLTLASVAARVGYASAYSLSHAFTRHRGHPPTAVRRAPRGHR